ncbi:MAG: MoxR family ATPase [Bdellovibrionaceae bacterium]|nr:MoxR family ATPase [Pseudobdellovibrionaceae bacterium]
MTKSNRIIELVQEVKKIIVGQEDMIQGILIGLFTEGHILIEGLPGLAKTLSVSTVAKAVSLKFKRVQFTPDLLPSDIIGTMVFNSSTGEFTAKKGPIFTNILLADEINRAPAKVQSALLEAMEEKQVTIGETTYPLPKPFLVLATQNPIEQEGTFPLPEAQTDRFLFKIKVDYPTENEEMAILNFKLENQNQQIASVLSPVDIFDIQTNIQKVHIDKKIKKYIVDLVLATRKPKNYGFPELESWIEIGASPRATVNFPKAIQSLAFFEGRDFVSIDDVKRLAPLILRHRIILSYEAQAEDITEEKIIHKILKDIEV